MKKKLVQNVRLTTEEAETLKEIAMKATFKTKEFVKESDLIHFVLGKTMHLIDIDEKGRLFMHDLDDMGKNVRVSK